MYILMDESGAMYGKKCHGQESSDTVTERGRSADRAQCCPVVTSAVAVGMDEPDESEVEIFLKSTRHGRVLPQQRPPSRELRRVGDVVVWCVALRVAQEHVHLRRKHQRRAACCHWPVPTRRSRAQRQRVVRCRYAVFGQLLTLLSTPFLIWKVF